MPRKCQCLPALRSVTVFSVKRCKYGPGHLAGRAPDVADGCGTLSAFWVRPRPAPSSRSATSRSVPGNCWRRVRPTGVRWLPPARLAFCSQKMLTSVVGPRSPSISLRMGGLNRLTYGQLQVSLDGRLPNRRPSSCRHAVPSAIHGTLDTILLGRRSQRCRRASPGGMRGGRRANTSRDKNTRPPGIRRPRAAGVGLPARPGGSDLGPGAGLA